MHVHDQILNFLQHSGPTLPAKVAKNIKTDILIASAHLSDLTSQGKVKISNLKVGGSPLYFLQGQEDQLYDFAADNLNPKDYAVLKKLKDRLVLREADLDLLAKVALRSLKDFAVPLHVRTQQTAEIFWKWHLASDEATKEEIAAVFNRLITPLAEPEQIKAEEMNEEAEKSQADQQETLLAVSERRVVAAKAQSTKEFKQQAEPAGSTEEVRQLQEVPKEGPEEELKTKKETEPEETVAVTEPEPAESESAVEAGPAEPADVSRQNISGQAGVVKISEKAKSVKKPRKRVVKADGFLPQLMQYFKELDIQVDEQEIVRKNSEINSTITVPSVVGRMTYLCKAKSKTRCNEKDLSAAYMEAQIKKLPLLFLYTQDLTKKAQEMLESGAFQNTIVKRIEPAD